MTAKTEIEAAFDVNENGGMVYNWELGDLSAFILQGQGTPGVSLSLSEGSAASGGSVTACFATSSASARLISTPTGSLHDARDSARRVRPAGQSPRPDPG